MVQSIQGQMVRAQVLAPSSQTQTHLWPTSQSVQRPQDVNKCIQIIAYVLPRQCKNTLRKQSAKLLKQFVTNFSMFMLPPLPQTRCWLRLGMHIFLNTFNSEDINIPLTDTALSEKNSKL